MENNSVHEDPNIGQDRKRKLSTMNNKKSLSNKDKPSPHLSDITSSTVNTIQSSRFTARKKSNIKITPSHSQTSKENADPYVPGTSLSDNICEIYQATNICTPKNSGKSLPSRKHVVSQNQKG